MTAKVYLSALDVERTRRIYDENATKTASTASYDAIQIEPTPPSLFGLRNVLFPFYGGGCITPLFQVPPAVDDLELTRRTWCLYHTDTNIV